MLGRAGQDHPYELLVASSNGHMLISLRTSKECGVRNPGSRACSRIWVLLWFIPLDRISFHPGNWYAKRASGPHGTRLECIEGRADLICCNLEDIPSSLVHTPCSSWVSLFSTCLHRRRNALDCWNLAGLLKDGFGRTIWSYPQPYIL